MRVYMTFHCGQLLVLLALILVFKWGFNRPRPIFATKRHTEAPDVPKRTIELASYERGTHAMPSGDAGMGSYWCGLAVLVFNIRSAILIIPLVALGRVYFRCHWIGDTVAGSLLGFGFAYLSVPMLPLYANFVLN